MVHLLKFSGDLSSGLVMEYEIPRKKNISTLRISSDK